MGDVEEDGNIAVDGHVELASCAQNMDISGELGRDRHQKAMDFRDRDIIFRHTGEFIWKINAGCKSESEKPDPT